jgi:hypothetical protein
LVGLVQRCVGREESWVWEPTEKDLRAHRERWEKTRTVSAPRD